ncbi:peptide-methionine (S)-S-oxide reductase MsrA [Levilactobacillus suantsaii]|uniref:Peptide methionine sulfoxide reductase MsrA n=1 Tax=Levilactobacillus suantsaii TaxID=2292255 RepID=A0A4Q0VLW5_9LACO|nr:peptide-methionine (S)-S-oxide reductase MsrA [Levilactobacillus suantsaii]QMU07561.1 peptide-methionine (S)-S-oxide reductase MsrA [Levilactobacillus suantsaii]RXI79696.1 peptide-methionine (S)-S-oxide reductase [Levilactobacillus suantsaii]
MSKIETATFAGGCFWCMVQPFEEQPGIERVLSGYTGGTVADPTYEQVKTGKTGHTEAVKIWFDAEQVSYRQLVDLYWQQTDPTDASGQFQDRGDNYRPVIFVNSAAQRQVAEASKQALQDREQFDQPIVTQIQVVQSFYPAEERHQQFYKKQPQRMAEQEAGGRAAFIQAHWTQG